MWAWELYKKHSKRRKNYSPKSSRLIGLSAGFVGGDLRAAVELIASIRKQRKDFIIVGKLRFRNTIVGICVYRERWFRLWLWRNAVEGLSCCCSEGKEHRTHQKSDGFGSGLVMVVEIVLWSTRDTNWTWKHWRTEQKVLREFRFHDMQSVSWDKSYRS